MTSGYAFAVACPTCSGSVRHVADGVASRGEASAVCECVACGARWLVQVRLLAVQRDPVGAERRRQYGRAVHREHATT